VSSLHLELLQFSFAADDEELRLTQHIADEAAPLLQGQTPFRGLVELRIDL
jgi:hypothetical protein